MYLYASFGTVKGIRYKYNKIMHKVALKQIWKAMIPCTLNFEFAHCPYC